MKTWYFDKDGNLFWPDAVLLSEKYHAFDWTAFMAQENDTITSVNWVVPTGLTNVHTSVNGTITSVKLRADTVGLYEIACEVETQEGTTTQKFIQKINLKVVD